MVRISRLWHPCRDLPSSVDYFGCLLSWCLRSGLVGGYQVVVLCVVVGWLVPLVLEAQLSSLRRHHSLARWRAAYPGQHQLCF
jgi:hypothetical protein